MERRRISRRELAAGSPEVRIRPTIRCELTNCWAIAGDQHLTKALKYFLRPLGVSGLPKSLTENRTKNGHISFSDQSETTVGIISKKRVLKKFKATRDRGRNKFMSGGLRSTSSAKRPLRVNRVERDSEEAVTRTDEGDSRRKRPGSNRASSINSKSPTEVKGLL
jgi:hypothetical protein